MPQYSSVDAARLSGYNRAIDSVAETGDAIGRGVAGIGRNVATGVKSVMGNRAKLAEFEATKKAKLQDLLSQYQMMKRQAVVAGMPTDEIDSDIQQVQEQLRKLETVDLSAPTPTSGILKAPNIKAREMGAIGA